MPGTITAPTNPNQSGRSSQGGAKTHRIDPKWPSSVRVGHQRPPLFPRRQTSLVSRQGVDEQGPSLDIKVRRPTALQQFFRSFSLERSFTVLGFVVAAFLVSAFGADLGWGWPFRHASSLFDASSVICGVILAYLSWDVFWEQVRGLTR